MNVGQVLSASATPVVLISACGLITLALYNRLATILARLRACHQQQLDLLNRLDEDPSQHATSQLELVQAQASKVTQKAKFVQKGLFCLLSSVVAFLGCSILSAAAVLNEHFGTAAIVSHVAGLSLFIVGIGWAIKELTISISPLDEVSNYLETALSTRLPQLERHDDAPRANLR
jgi:predicted acyltransferase